MSDLILSRSEGGGLRSHPIASGFVTIGHARVYIEENYEVIDFELSYDNLSNKAEIVFFGRPIGSAAQFDVYTVKEG